MESKGRGEGGRVPWGLPFGAVKAKKADALAGCGAAKAWSMGGRRESEISLGLGVQGGHEGPPDHGAGG